VIRISITAAAFEATASTLPFAQAAAAEKAKLAAQKAWQTRRASPNYVALDRLRHLRGPGESYSDVILRLVAETEGDA
jgi:hypothetical protein